MPTNVSIFIQIEVFVLVLKPCNDRYSWYCEAPVWVRLMIGNILASDQTNNLTILWSAVRRLSSCWLWYLVTLCLNTRHQTNRFTGKILLLLLLIIIWHEGLPLLVPETPRRLSQLSLMWCLMWSFNTWYKSSVEICQTNLANTLRVHHHHHQHDAGCR